MYVSTYGGLGQVPRLHGPFADSWGALTLATSTLGNNGVGVNLLYGIEAKKV